MTPIWLATVNAGIVNFEQKQEFTQYVRGFEGKVIEVVVRKFRKHRSNPQNAWFHACILPILTEAMGEPNTVDGKEYAKEALKFHFLRITGPGGFERVRGTSDLSTEEFSVFCEQCRQLAAEMYGINIPDPGKYE